MKSAIRDSIDNDEHCYGQHPGRAGMMAVVEGGTRERASFAFPKDAPKLPEVQGMSPNGKHNITERKRR